LCRVLNIYKNICNNKKMYVRTKSTKRNPNVYVQLVEGLWLDGKSKQSVVKHIGTGTNPEEVEKLKEIGNEIKVLYMEKRSEEEINRTLDMKLSQLKGHRSQILNCKEKKRINTGIKDIYGKIYDDIGLNNIVQSKSNYKEIVKNLVLGRIVSPNSKRDTCELLESFLDIKYPLNSLYRAMDKINEDAIEIIQDKVTKYSKKMLNGEINLIFYDVTSIYFESFTEDDLKKLGYSKDGKFNQPQLILTLLVSGNGLPLGYQLLPGNKYEGHTLIDAMKYWKKKYPDNKFVLVADAGLLNDVNLNYLDSQGIDYIVCARIKNLSRKEEEKILLQKKSSEGGFFGELSYKNRRLIVSYSVARAKKNCMDREKSLEKLMHKLKSSNNPISLISNYGYEKYIAIDKNSEVVLNQEKIDHDKAWDGLHGIITSLTGFPPKMVYQQYRGLWQIENAFRINKSDLKIRPIFHWTPSRVKAHIAISYMAYSCYQYVQFKLHEKGFDFSCKKIRDLLFDTKATIMEDRYTGDQFFIPSKIDNDVLKIYRALNLKVQNSSYHFKHSKK
jgi:transposase